MKHRIVFDIITAIGCIFAVALGFEAFVRFVVDDGMQYDLEMWKYARDVKRLANDPLIGHEHVPNQRTHLMGVDFATNSKGLRDREFAYERTSKNRILMLGDSLTVGWGTPVEEVFAKRIEKMYAQSGIDAEIINTGVGNYNTIQEVQYFLTEGYKYHPDTVVLNFYVNDAEPVPAHRLPSNFESRCYSCNFIAGRLDTLLRKFSKGKDWAEYYLGLFGDGTTPGWLAAKDYIGKLSTYCKAYGIKLLVVSLPELHNVQNYRFQRITDLVHEAANQNGVNFIDVLPYLRNEDSSTLWVSPPDPHPNSLAHKLIAIGVFDGLKQASVPR